MVNVVGLGYIGLPTALILAAHGVEVVGTDLDEQKVATLRRGELTFQEEGLSELYQQALDGGITFTTEYPKASVYIISVPTPYEEKTKKVDASYVVRAVECVLPVCEKGTILVIESTIAPGTIDRHVRPVVEAAGFVINEDIYLAHAPERIIPGNMIHELMYNNRTIGADVPEVGERVKALYASFCQGRITLTDIRTAEMSKVVENTYRDINIAYANELAKICREQGLDVYEIIEIANQHPRVNILMPGPGVGGHCIPIDPWFLVGDYPTIAKVVKAAREVNDAMPEFVLERIYKIMQAHGIRDVARVGLYGLTYKANVDDVRDSPTLQMLDCMRRHLATGAIKVYDPMVSADLVPNQCHSLDSFLSQVDMVVILVDHREILDHMEQLRGKVVLDTKNVCPLEGSYHL